MSKTIDIEKTRRVVQAFSRDEEQQALAELFDFRVKEAQDLVANVEDTPLCPAARRYLEAVVALFTALRRRDALETQRRAG